MKSLVASFSVDHTKLQRGFYLRSVYKIWGFYPIKSYDMRFRAPMEHDYLSSEAMHTIEHIMAHYLRTILGEAVVSFSPMGCKTGFYLIVKGFVPMAKVEKAVIEVVDRYLPLRGKEDVPGLTVEQCGNPALYSVEECNTELAAYAEMLRRQL